MAQLIKLSEVSGVGKDQAIIADHNEAYEFAYRNTYPWLNAANDDYKFYLGDQWTNLEKRALSRQKRSALVFNKIRRIVKMIGGFERKTRMSLIAEPVEFQDEQLADDWSQILIHQMNIMGMHMVMSDAFEASLKVGMSLVSLTMDYKKDMIEGNPILHRIPHNMFLIDPRFTKRDLSDAEFITNRRQLSKEALKGLYPYQDELIDSLRSTNDNKYPGMTAKRNMMDDDIVNVDEFWRRKTKQVNVLYHTESQVAMQIGNESLDREKIKYLREQFPGLELVKKAIPTVELNVIAEGQVLHTSEDPYGQGDFPHIPILCFFDPDYNSLENDTDSSLRIQGIVRGLKDAQVEVNKRRSKALDILDSQINSGWIAKEGTLKNTQDFFETGQGKVMLLNRNALMTDIQKIQAPDIPPNMIAFSEILDKDLMEIAGASSELFGMPENENMQISGLLAKVRQGAGLTILQDIFDNFRYSQKLLGNKIIKTVRNNFSEQKIMRVLGKPPSPNFFQTNVEDFDILVEEAVETPNQKNLQFLQLMQARQAGIAIPDSIIIDAMPLQNKAELKALLEQQSQVQSQMQMQTQQSVNAMSQAKALSDFALAQERTARVQENLSQKVENQADAALARTRAIKELEEMDINRVLKILSFVKTMEQDAAQQTNALVLQNQQLAENNNPLEGLNG